MKYAELEERYDGFYAPRFEVRIAEQTYTEAEGTVTALEIDTVVDGADRCSLLLDAPFDPERGALEGMNWDDIAVGNTLVVAIGYGDRLKTLFDGRISSVRPEFATDGPPAVEVNGYDRSFAMTHETKSRSWDETTDSDVVEDVVSAYEFTEVTVDPTGVVHRKRFQERESDYRFLVRLAERNGFELFSRNGALAFRSPPYDADPSVTLAYGQSLAAFMPEFADRGEVGTVHVRHWDPANKREIVGTAENPAGGDAVRVLRLPVASKEEADREAAAALNSLRNRTVRGSGESVGIPEIRAGETIELKNIDMFTNVYYIQSATHSVSNSGYTTAFEVTERSA
ncbi:contractile injection system protein, VgrG/Pvc8 family [Halogeometricum sp. S1BR25-6]|uniref:Contractile injection system protein, VgrG/Pvc8 family n=1 Tax=Halogeometricum salsisoli TaxID=2950536 RepID=A0ABU2GJZ6_9EURY|nr:contractile injection system protein, VgrG/Pvc8 family [Halogeometricum sp. S1BR25-6]MDS0301124.1 contractile injection system protein, VgrG/Pvc8 family [Halogeometricum sp. S1BR25-6]